ncbi:MAG: PCRF domain-containing protein [Kosmotogaceae bacterium]
MKNSGDIFELSKKEERIKEISQEMSSNSFWENQTKANQLSKELKDLQNIVEDFQVLTSGLEELEILYELNYQENSKEVWEEILQKTEKLEKEINRLFNVILLLLV